MKVLLRAPAFAWRKLRALLSLVHGYDDVSGTYGDNPNGLSDGERLTARGMGSNNASFF